MRWLMSVLKRSTAERKILRILGHREKCDSPQHVEGFAIHEHSCLFNLGKNDIITPPEVAEEFHAGFPDSDLFWIDECGHAPMMEHPKQFNTILDAWFAGRGIGNAHG